MHILERIVAQKRIEVDRQKQTVPLDSIKLLMEIKPRARFSLLQKMQQDNDFHFICEIKKASPSAGTIRSDLNLKTQAQAYKQGGASAISVLTDKSFFKGSLKDFTDVRAVALLPLLRKDFIIDPYQIWQSAVIGADVILLIARILSRSQIKAFAELAAELGLDILIELHDAREIEKLPASLENLPVILGINNRNLDTFEIDLVHSSSLLPHLPTGIPVISESGIRTERECIWLQEQGFRGVLIGETLMRQKNPIEFLKNLRKATHGIRTA